MSTEEFHKFLLSAFKAMASVSEPGCVVYIVMSSREWPTVQLAATEAGYHWSSTIIWAKDTFVLSRKDYNTQYEPIWYGWLDGSKRLCEVKDNRQSDLWEIKRPMKSPEHPTMKPIALAARAMENSSYNGDAVLDLFGGSGTTLMAAEQLERSAYLMELSPTYCDVICRRYRDWQKTDEGIFLLRNGEKMAFCEVPDP
jgi:DNA modification methylase